MPFLPKISTLAIVLLTIVTAQAQHFSNPFETHRLLDVDVVDEYIPNVFNVPWEPEKSFTVINFSDDYYVANLFLMDIKPLNLCLKFRLEDELPNDNNTYMLQDMFYLDFTINYNIRAFNFSVGLENLLGMNNSDVSIKPELIKHTLAYNELVFCYDSAYLISAGVSYKF